MTSDDKLGDFVVKFSRTSKLFDMFAKKEEQILKNSLRRQILRKSDEEMQS